MNLHTLLKQRAASNQPVRVGLIGAGKFGSMYLAQARVTDGIHLVAVADLQLERASSAMARTGWPAEQVARAETGTQICDAAAGGKTVITEDPAALITADLDVVVECTGNPEAGARHALSAIEAGCHVVMVTVEADALIGPLLARRAEQAGVVYSMAYGDQPALICEMVDWAHACGFSVVSAGKGTKHRPEYHYSTPETVFDHFGLSPEQIETGGFNAKMFNSFLDGTKSAIEMAAVANATGLAPQPHGLSFPPLGVTDLADGLKPRADGGLLSHRGTVEVVSCVNADGTLVPGDLRWGVYVTFDAPSDYTKQCFGEYGMLVDRSGQFAAMFRPNHLIGLELGVSVASAALRREPTGVSRQLMGDVVACAKRDLAVGEQLDGEGGYTVFGKLLPARDSISRRALPMGLAAESQVIRPVARNQVVNYEDVQLPQDSLIVRLRQELEDQ